jgi:hypothetical protein
MPRLISKSITILLHTGIWSKDLSKLAVELQGEQQRLEVAAPVVADTTMKLEEVCALPVCVYVSRQVLCPQWFVQVRSRCTVLQQQQARNEVCKFPSNIMHPLSHFSFPNL